MVDKNIGAVLVVDEDDQLVGIFTERDVVHLTAKGVAFGSRPIRSAMSRNLITFKASVDVSAAMSVISDQKKRHLPVVEDDKIAGIITYRDLVSYLLPEVVYMAREIY
jgi:CBS domain-containing protein